MEVRALCEEDHARVAPVVDEWWGGRHMSYLLPRLFFRHFGDTSFVVEEDGEVVAFLVGFVSQGVEGEAYVHFVGVHPEHRGRGLGARLYGLFFEEVGGRGCTRVRCITSPVNRGSVAFHERMGFEVLTGDGEVDGIPVHRDYDGAGKDKVVCVKELP
jgi:ribosomal protein S18 acetylase RimI-like enzyme